MGRTQLPQNSVRGNEDGGEEVDEGLNELELVCESLSATDGRRENALPLDVPLPLPFELIEGHKKAGGTNFTRKQEGNKQGL